MSELKKDAIRVIIKDFAKEIKKTAKTDATPSLCVIPFRDDRQKNKERPVVEVKLDLLRFRGENGRISSDVMSYQKNCGQLKEHTEDAQSILRNFLLEKDKEKTEELIKSVKHGGQREPAVITSDGFLINGNRRKMALEHLYNKTNDDKYNWMKVVILPGENDSEDGGPPTIKEIEQLENRYQLQSEGKAEYYGFDQALSIRRKIQQGITLEELLKDDPQHEFKTEKDFKKVVREYNDKYLGPLDCVDDYLENLNRVEDYKTVSAFKGDKEGRWQAFIDYSKVRNQLSDENFRIKNGIDEDEVGDIQEVAFKIIRKREFPELPKLHSIMRQLPKWLKNQNSKKELLKLLSVDDELPESDQYDEDGNEKSEKDKDIIWSSVNQEKLIKQVKKAKSYFEQDLEQETPLTILDGALKKLNHGELKPENTTASDAKQAMKLCDKIQKRAKELGSEFYTIQKKPQQLKDKFNNKH